MMLQIENVKPAGVNGLLYRFESSSVVFPPRGSVIERVFSITIKI